MRACTHTAGCGQSPPAGGGAGDGLARALGPTCGAAACSSWNLACQSATAAGLSDWRAGRSEGSLAGAFWKAARPAAPAGGSALPCALERPRRRARRPGVGGSTPHLQDAGADLRKAVRDVGVDA
jgi:hypothetical protein